MPSLDRVLRAAALLPLLIAREPGAWWQEGHRLVARLAELRLTPQTRAAVDDLLEGESLADAALWADQVKDARPDTKPLHYVNIPLRASAYDSAADCGRGCVITAIESDRRTLADPAAPRAARAEALRFLVHFVGDLHQPLHVADNSDRGGNRRLVWFFGDSTNLHSVWDGELIDSSTAGEAPYFEELRQELERLNPDEIAALERGTVVDWAMEGHDLAKENAYPRVPRGGRIGEAYVRANRPIVDHALVAAGVRLAKVLNEALGSYRASPPDTTPNGAATLGPGVYADQEAAAHLGETATVVGTVAAVFRSRKGTVYLNFGADYPRQRFTAVVLAPAPGWAAGLDTLRGRRVGVRGRIQSYRGRVEIVLERPDQIAPPPAP